MIKFSIITVCLNAENYIRGTIQSILEQTTSNYEYIIKDGVSADETVRIARSFSTAFDKKGISYRIVSQKDTGVYDAMNQAIQETQGEWILFMNAGDRIADADVLAKVEKHPCLQEADIIYGDNVSKMKEWLKYSKARDLESFKFCLPFCHQSTFTRRELFDNSVYSTKYKLCSDYHFYYQLYRQGKRFCYIPEALSIYDINGISSDWRKSDLEKIHILEEMPVRDEEALQILKQNMKKKHRRILVRQILHRFIPKRLSYKIWERNRRKEGWKIEKEFYETRRGNT